MTRAEESISTSSSSRSKRSAASSRSTRSAEGEPFEKYEMHLEESVSGSLAYSVSRSESVKPSSDEDSESPSNVVCSIHSEESPCPERFAAYKHQILQNHMKKSDSESCASLLVNQLTDFGVDVYLVPFDSHDIFGAVRGVCNAVSDAVPKLAANYRCCLFKDEHDRLFNLVIAGGSSAAGLEWKQVNATFSGTKAVITIVLLSKMFSCFATNYGLNPSIVALILGLVCNEEMSFVSMNTCIHVQGHPSVGAYALMQPTLTDWPKKLVVFMLAIAGASSNSTVKKGITWAGVFFAVFIMSANVGARAWGNMCLTKQKYSGPLYSVIAMIKAFVLGLFFPYFGSRGCEPGGHVALMNTLKSALIVAFVFIASGFWQQFNESILITTQQETPTCSQDYVYIVVGSWYTVSLLASICFYKRIIPEQVKPIPESASREPLLVEDVSSPVGFRVPNFPDYVLDPAHDFKPIQFCSAKCDVAFGVLLALGLGGGIVAWGITSINMMSLWFPPAYYS
mmetsp:Transcript_13854/g.19844  ORF Transcript_13854/g.19844 Transcript_13854/m.19844 type:complete len:510 (-) Transcript_13854:1428-2957(-)